MARTAHHRPRARHTYDTHLTTVLHDLRFSAAALADAARDGRRARPQGVRRRVTVRHRARAMRDPSVARWAAEQERSARQRLRGQLRPLRALVDQPAGPLDLDAADAVDVLPARHRRLALWLA
ncbi:hypothetical protein [Streptomyces sp. TRM64462]|uniref:hypothetical protein n=1 Tax=Streptomyces sp. TRM64462 TaxID=2741726 RepID=UPI0020C79DA0|nr:hypothetical protein [Streptomyces sp. TRM64462]